MRLKIHNFAKVKDANIIINGITVIAGENNTGKSTIGKVLYSVFNSLYNIDSKIEEQREKEIRDIINRNTRELYASMYSENRISYISISQRFEEFLKEFLKELLQIDKESLTIEVYKEIILTKSSKYGIKIQKQELNNLIEATYDNIITRKKNDNYKIALELIQRFFMQTFCDQAQCLKFSESTAEVSLKIKDRITEIKFKDNKCIEWSNNYNILHEAFFIDDPFVLDDANYMMRFSQGIIRRHLLQKIQKVDNDIMGGLFDAVSAKENLQDIYNILNQVTKGNILFQNRQWGLSSEQLKENVNFENLSAGLKSFVLIKLLLEKGILKERDVLILDEPEIHLHPEWQLFYAEIIVLLQKKFELSIIVTTHSSHFLEAIEYYSKKHNVEDKCEYYLASLEEGLATFENVTGSLNKIYKQMVTPSILLDRLKEKLDEEDE